MEAPIRASRVAARAPDTERAERAAAEEAGAESATVRPHVLIFAGQVRRSVKAVQSAWEDGKRHEQRAQAPGVRGIRSEEWEQGL